ncbi:MAG: transposase [Alphaproteobacteria bacterium]|nr:transposase [Alphaproteobacteria bacterium]
MVDPTPFLPGLSPVDGKALQVRFDGGLVSSDGGLLLFREIDNRLGLAARLAACVNDGRDPERVTHTAAAILRFRMLGIDCYLWMARA